MHQMTRNARPGVIRAAFDGRTFRLKDDSVQLTQDGDDRFMQITSRFGNEIYRVTRVIGGHHREDFAGVQVFAPKVGASSQGPEKILPVSHVIATGELRYKGYSVMLPDRPGVKAGPVWNRTCILCHNTASWLTTSLGLLGGPGGPKYQGAFFESTLPTSRQSWPVIRDHDALRRALQSELSPYGSPRLDGDDKTVIKQAAHVIRRELDAPRLLEIGIGCESCHLGSKEHSLTPNILPSFSPTAQFLTNDTHQTKAQAKTRVCGRCHQVLFTGYPFTWEGGERRNNPGGSNINSGEARDLLLGACATQMTCSHCHDVHAADGGASKLAKLDTIEGNSTCTSCHPSYADHDKLAAHTHHKISGTGSMCVSCHMPRKTMTLDTTLGRYHRVSSPNEPRKIESDRPLECALCHREKTVRALLDDIESWWPKRFDRAAVTKLYGSLDVPPLFATLSSGKPHEQAVAMFVLGDAHDPHAAAAIAPHLLHSRPILRYYARSALEKIFGEPAPLDVHAPNEEIAREATKWLGRHGITLTLSTTSSTSTTSDPDSDGPDAR